MATWLSSTQHAIFKPRHHDTSKVSDSHGTQSLALWHRREDEHLMEKSRKETSDPAMPNVQHLDAMTSLPPEEH